MINKASAPKARTKRLEKASLRASSPSPVTANKGGTAPPTLAPATSASPSAGVMIAAFANSITKMTTARLEEPKIARPAAKINAKSGASSSADRSVAIIDE